MTGGGGGTQGRELFPSKKQKKTNPDPFVKVTISQFTFSLQNKAIVPLWPPSILEQINK